MFAVQMATILIRLIHMLVEEIFAESEKNCKQQNLIPH